MKKIILTILSYCLIFGFGIFGGTLITGCKSAPKRDSYKLEECYAAARCVYQTENVEVCRTIINECGIAYQEQRIKKRHEYCKDKNNRTELQTYNGCFLQLIPKKSG